MKLLILLLISSALIGCGKGEEAKKKYEWVVERGNRPSEHIQRDFNTMGGLGWYWNQDDDLEVSGHYVYFGKRMKPSEAQAHLAATWKAMSSPLDTPK